MAKLTREEAAKAVEEMADAGINEGEIDGFLRDNGILPQFNMDQPTGKQGLDFALSMLPVAGAVTGGAAVPALAKKFLPRAAAAIPHAIQTGLGIATGTTAGNLAVDPSHPKEAVQQGAWAGLFGGSAEGLMNLITRGLGSMGGVQSPAVSQALGKGTGARTVFSKPATPAEAELGGTINESLKPSNLGLSPGRLVTESQLSKLQSGGYMVDMTPTIIELDSRIAKLESGGVGRGPSTALSNLKKIRSDLISKYVDQGQAPRDIVGKPTIGAYGEHLANPQITGRTAGIPPRIAVTPQEADLINQQIQDTIGDSFGKPGGTSTIRNLKGVSKVNTAEFRKQTGTAESAETTRLRLRAIDKMRKQISEATPESFVRGVGDALMTQGESGDQSALLALREFDKSGRLEAQIKQLASQRQWTGSQSRIAHNIKWEFVRRAPRFLAKLTTVATRPTGIGVGAAAAFEQAMQPRNNP